MASRVDMARYVRNILTRVLSKGLVCGSELDKVVPSKSRVSALKYAIMMGYVRTHNVRSSCSHSGSLRGVHRMYTITREGAVFLKDMEAL